jgi:phosphate starvation-inducible protein PhoH and related proteins
VKLTYSNLTIEQWQLLCGIQDDNLKLLTKQLNIEVSLNHQEITIKGQDSQLEYARLVIDSMVSNIIQGYPLGAREIIYLCQLAVSGNKVSLSGLFDEPVVTTHLGKVIYPKTLNQQQLFRQMQQYDIVFAVGPAGTGKTYMAVAYALSLFKKNIVNKLILTRPAVEAGENLGFLPGDLKEKIDPYLRPLYDALYDILGPAKVEKYLELGVIEIAPLAFMRGRTLENAFVILDEAQNTTITQMKMFLTRMGFNSKMVVTGDVTQIDLHRHVTSGLVHSIDVLSGIREIALVQLTSMDVVRNPLVQKIIEAYQADEEDRIISGLR